MRSLIVAALLAVSAFGVSREAQAGSCSDRRAQLAATQAETLPDWGAVTRYWKRFRSCEGDAVRHNVSTAIGTLLVAHWNQLPSLAAAVRRQPKLRGFVLSHIDGTMDRDQVTQIRQEASTSCPRGTRSLCADIRRAATRTLDHVA